MTREHHLTITPDDDGDDFDTPGWQFEITCLAPTKCGGFQECPDEHQVAGVSAADGPDADESAPWFDEEEFEFHGVMHEWRYGFGWTVPFDGCVVSDALNWNCDSAADIADRHGAGVHVVDDEWDDSSCTLIWVKTVEGPS